MKQIKIMVLVICRLILFIFLIGVPVAYGAPREEGLRITPGQFEYGVVEEGQVITATAMIENKGSGVVEITNVRTN